MQNSKVFCATYICILQISDCFPTFQNVKSIQDFCQQPNKPIKTLPSGNVLTVTFWRSGMTKNNKGQAKNKESIIYLYYSVAYERMKIDVLPLNLLISSFSLNFIHLSVCDWFVCCSVVLLLTFPVFFFLFFCFSCLGSVGWCLPWLFLFRLFQNLNILSNIESSTQYKQIT